MRLQIAWSLLPRLVQSCAIVDQRRVRGLALRASRGQIFIAITRTPARPGLSFQGRLLPFFPVIAASRACSYRGEIFTSFHQFSPVRGLLLKLMLWRRNVSCTGVLLLI